MQFKSIYAIASESGTATVPLFATVASSENKVAFVRRGPRVAESTTNTASE